METVWFFLVSFMVTMYVVLDGFDIGAGVVHLFVARNRTERRLITRSIGPVWDGNEVWLIAAVASLYLAFPEVYARSFSGFYLPLMIVLWLLILRGIALELGGHLRGSLWQPFFEKVFGLASLALALFFGAALGNVVRGVPFDEKGRFFEPLWTHFGTRGQTGVLDWYTLLVGLTAALGLTMHGALWVVYKTEGGLRDRARRLALRAWLPLGAAVALVTFATYEVQPHVAEQLVTRPWGLGFPCFAVAGWLAMRRATLQGDERRAFLMSCVFLCGLLASGFFGLYPYLLPSNGDPGRGLTVFNAAAPPYGLKVALWWWIPGVALAVLYFRYTYRHFAGKVTLED